MDMFGAIVGQMNTYFGGISSGTWPSANKALFYPFRLGAFATARQLLWFVGATSAGNIDMGIYDSQGGLIVSAGSTAMSATVNTVQELNIADTVLAPGAYFLAFGCSSTSGTIMRQIPSDENMLGSAPIYEQTSAIALPDPATPVISTEGNPPLCGVAIQFATTF